MDLIRLPRVRPRRHVRLVPWAAAACLALVGLAVSPEAHAAPSQRSPAAHSAAATGHYGSVANLTDVSTTAVSGVITAGSCKYQQVSDDVHFSSTGWAASGHGWWAKSSGTCPSRANVDIELQAVWCDRLGCYWKTVASGSKDVYSGGGSANRAAAREDCAGSSIVGWRSRVDVDLIGVSDPSGWTYSAGEDMACYPSS
jgi:hypothetical protein